MKIVTAAEMREIDRRTMEEFGIPSLTLMENAGSAVAEFCLREYSGAKTIGVICGKGNNGGDGFVAARKLHEAGKSVRVLLLADPTDVKGDAAEMLKRLPVQPVIARDEKELEKPECEAVYDQELLIDAILGTGFKPPVGGVYAQAISLLWQPNSHPVVSVDVPSGTNADARIQESDNVARSNAIVTFTAAKLAHVFQKLTDGAIVVAQIGSPSEVIESELKLDATTSCNLNLLRGPRNEDSNKGNYGHVLVVGGSRGKAGAPAMAGMAALASGAGLCTIATAASIQNVVSSFAPELMTEELAETDKGTISFAAIQGIKALAEKKSVMAIGPGLSRNAESAQLAREIVATSKVPVVLDADGLNAFEGQTHLLNGSSRVLILTPHPGEMARLTGLSVPEVQANRIEVARRFAGERNCIVVLKGWRSVIAEPGGQAVINMTGNPGMAKGGSGDVLTGMIAGMLAQHWPQRGPLLPVVAAVYVHGIAGDMACRERGPNSVMATDLIKQSGRAYQNIVWNPRMALLKPPSPDPWWYRNRNRVV